MAFDPHIRMSMTGVFLNTTEIFSYSISLGRFDVPQGSIQPINPNDTVWNDLRNDAMAFHSRAGTGISAFAQLRQVKFAPIGSDGKYTGAPVVKEAVVGGGGGNGYIYPPQIALAVTTHTDAPLSRVKGRFYLPAINYPMDGSARLAQGAADAVAASADTFLEAVNNQPGVDVLGIGACVPSSTEGGRNFRITGVTVGRALDTMRTRRNRMLEVYATALPVDD